MAKYPQPILVLKMVYQSKNRQFSNPSFWTCDTPPSTNEQMSTLVTAAEAYFAPLYKACISNSSTWNGVQGLYLTGGNNYIGASTANAGAGTGGTDPLPDQNAVVLAKETGKYGRQYLGRYFIGCVPQGAVSPDDANQVVSSGEIVDSYFALAQGFGADRTFGASVCHARHWDRKSSSLIPITKVYLRSRFATQRRRRRAEPDNLLSNS